MIWCNAVKVLKVVYLNDKACFKRATSGSAGFDLCYAGSEPVMIGIQNRKILPTGIKVAIPEGWFGLIKDRSGFAAKKGLHVLAGVVDSDYRGEVKVVLYNSGNEPVIIKPGERIAQMVVIPVYQGPVVEVEKEEELGETERGERGFGSTGTR